MTVQRTCHLAGIAACFKEYNPTAVNVHCLAHCLNLCLQDAGKKCKLIRDALDIVQEVTQKRNHAFEALKNEMRPNT